MDQMFAHLITLRGSPEELKKEIDNVSTDNLAYYAAFYDDRPATVYFDYVVAAALLSVSDIQQRCISLSRIVSSTIRNRSAPLID